MAGTDTEPGLCRSFYFFKYFFVYLIIFMYLFIFMYFFTYVVTFDVTHRDQIRSIPRSEATEYRLRRMSPLHAPWRGAPPAPRLSR